MQDCRRKIDRAQELGSVVRTMKALAAASVGQYERARAALTDYERAVRQGLSICLRATRGGYRPGVRRLAGSSGAAAIVFGSDQGLVGRFNDSMAQFALAAFEPGREVAIAWAIGQRVHACLSEVGFALPPPLPVPNSVGAITTLVQQLLLRVEQELARGRVGEVRVFFHRIRSAAVYGPIAQRLLPLDDDWRKELVALPWPTRNVAQVAGALEPTLAALVREYLFVTLFRAAADSLASENASRLAAMQRAEGSIDELLEDQGRAFNRLRQGAIDAELFDVVAGFEAVSHER